MGTRLVDPEDVAALVIDLGRIEVKTTLLKKEKDVDYRQIDDPSLLYDQVQVKFANLRIVVDYKLRLHQQAVTER